MDVDAIILAYVLYPRCFCLLLNDCLRTGLESSREKLRRILGDSMIDKTSELGGEDEHGEIRFGYKPSGQRGVSQKVVLKLAVND